MILGVLLFMFSLTNAGFSVWSRPSEEEVVVIEPPWPNGTEEVPYTWQSPGNSEVPSNPFQAGKERDGTPRYLCRVNHRDSVHPGKVVSKLCNIAVIEEKIEYRKENYEVLTDVSGLEWTDVGQVDKSTIVLVADEDSDQKRFICRATWQEGTHPGEALELGSTCYVPYDDGILEFSRDDSYELLVLQKASE